MKKLLGIQALNLATAMVRAPYYEGGGVTGVIGQPQVCHAAETGRTTGATSATGQGKHADFADERLSAGAQITHADVTDTKTAKG